MKSAPDSRDGYRPVPLLLDQLTGTILEAAFEVSNELGIGFMESVYEGALFIALRARGLRVDRQTPIKVHFRGQMVGHFYADLLVEGAVILELKAVRTLAPEHQAQVLNYLRATGHPIGMLFNFGAPKLDYRRFDNRFLNRDEGDKGDEKSPTLD